MSSRVCHVVYTEDGTIFVATEDRIRGFIIDQKYKLQQFYSTSFGAITCLTANNATTMVMWGDNKKIYMENYKSASMTVGNMSYDASVLKCNERFIAVGSRNLVEVYSYPQFESVWKCSSLAVNPAKSTLSITNQFVGSYVVFPDTSKSIMVVDPVHSNSTTFPVPYGSSYVTVCYKSGNIAVASVTGTTIEIRTRKGELVTKLARGLSVAVIEHISFDAASDRIVVSSSTPTIHIFTARAEGLSSDYTVTNALNAVKESIGVGKSSVIKCKLPKEDMHTSCSIIKIGSIKFLVVIEESGTFYSYTLSGTDSSDDTRTICMQCDLSEVGDAFQPLIIESDEELLKDFEQITKDDCELSDSEEIRKESDLSDSEEIGKEDSDLSDFELLG